jgi:hypothetical protein
LAAENDYRVNLKAELEIRDLHEKVDHILTRKWERLAEIQQIQLEMMPHPTRANADVGEIASGLVRGALLLLCIQETWRGLRVTSFGCLSWPAGPDNHTVPAHS